MKQFYQPYCYAFSFLGCGALLFSFILAILYYFNLINTQFLQISTFILSFLTFFFSGWIFAKKAKKKALFQALLVSCLFFLSGMLLTSQINPITLSLLGIKTGAFSLGCFIVMNRFQSSSLK